MNQDFKKYEHAIESLFAYLNSKSGMTRVQLNRLSGNIIVRHFERKSMIISPGEVDHYFNFIVKGVVRKFVISGKKEFTSGKKEFTLQLSAEGHFIHAELSFFTQTSSDCFIEALESTVLFSVSYSELERLYIEMPELNKLARLMIGEMYLKKEMRDMSYLRHTPRERFLQFVENHPDMLQRISQKYIASYLHIKAETFSRLKHLLK